MQTAGRLTSRVLTRAARDMSLAPGGAEAFHRRGSAGPRSDACRSRESCPTPEACLRTSRPKHRTLPLVQASGETRFAKPRLSLVRLVCLAGLSRPERRSRSNIFYANGIDAHECRNSPALWRQGEASGSLALTCLKPCVRRVPKPGCARGKLAHARGSSRLSFVLRAVRRDQGGLHRRCESIACARCPCLVLPTSCARG